jgi:hypothetical protein
MISKFNANTNVKKNLVGTDDSEYSMRALEFAFSLAKKIQFSTNSIDGIQHSKFIQDF